MIDATPHIPSAPAQDTEEDHRVPPFLRRVIDPTGKPRRVLRRLVLRAGPKGASVENFHDEIEALLKHRHGFKGGEVEFLEKLRTFAVQPHPKLSGRCHIVMPDKDWSTFERIRERAVEARLWAILRAGRNAPQRAPVRGAPVIILSTTPLPAQGTFTGPALDCSGKSLLAVSVTADQAGTLSLHLSADGVLWDRAPPDMTRAIAANNPVTLSGYVTARFLRVVFTNDGADQTSFALTTTLT